MLVGGGWRLGVDGSSCWGFLVVDGGWLWLLILVDDDW